MPVEPRRFHFDGWLTLGVLALCAQGAPERSIVQEHGANVIAFDVQIGKRFNGSFV